MVSLGECASVVSVCCICVSVCTCVLRVFVCMCVFVQLYKCAEVSLGECEGSGAADPAS